MAEEKKGADKSAAAPAPAKPAFKIAKRVTVRTMKVEKDEIFVKFESKIETKKKMEKDEAGKMVEKTIDVARVTDLTTGESVQIVIGSVLRSDLGEHYPNDSYVGKGFRLQKKDVPGKRYKTYEIDELDLSGK